MPSRPVLLGLLAFADFAASATAAGLEPIPHGEAAAAVADALEQNDECEDGETRCALSALQLRGQKFLGATNDTLDTSDFTGYSCQSSLVLGPVARAPKKGMCLDDATFELCAGEIPRMWPHTTEPIRSLRLFKPWGVAPPTIFKTDRTRAWSNLKAFVRENNVQIFLGTSVSCDQEADDREWELSKELMRDLGREHVMGLSIGNELEILWMKSREYQNAECLDRLFAKQGYVKKFAERVAELDTLPGFAGLPVTAVLGMYATAGQPWVQSPQAGIRDFLDAVWRQYGRRFVFSFNVYPYFDPSNRCDRQSVASALSMAGGGQVPGAVARLRSRMVAMGAGNAKLWVSETGWSTPETASIAASVKGCAAFSSAETFKGFYKNFLGWDLAGADHVFYFTIHDSANFHETEHFGLLKRCGSQECKLQG